MSDRPLTVLAIRPGTVISREDRARLRRGGVILISANPEDVRAIDVAPAAPLGVMLRAALETVNEKRSFSDGRDVRAEFAKRLIDYSLAATPTEAKS